VADVTEIRNVFSGQKKPHAILPAAVLLVGAIATYSCAHREVKYRLHVLNPGFNWRKYSFT